MQVRELWSQQDQVEVATFAVAVRNNDLAGALLAIEGASPSGAAECRLQLYELGTRIRGAAAFADPPTAMVQVLVDQEGFHGDSEDYYNPRNSFLSTVLERRRGLPILLSAVWMLVGEEAGLNVDGIGLPGHFVVRVGGAEGVMVDPFAGGHMISESDCAQMVTSLSSGAVVWSDSFLAPTSHDNMLERVLRNLLNSFQRAGEPEMLYRTARFYAALRPLDPDPQLIHARLAEALGARKLAIDLYRSVQDHFPGTPAADTAGTRIIELREQRFDVN